MTKSAAALMAADEFDRVAQTCRWSARSLEVVKALLVEGKSPSAVAEAFEMSSNQTGVLRRRFEAKAEALKQKRLTAEDFMQVVKPEGDVILDPFRKELVQLRKSGYTNEQLLLYLAENGIDTTETNLDQYLMKVTSHANTRNSK